MYVCNNNPLGLGQLININIYSFSYTSEIILRS